METGGSEIIPGITYFPLSSHVRVHLDHRPILELPSRLEAEVERVWNEQKEVKNLYNSLLFCMISHDQYKIHGQFIEYRYFIACQYIPELRKSFTIHPIGVSGLCFSGEKILIGTRDSKLSSYGGYKECVPSGSIETRAYSHGEVDFFMQLLWELEEEAHVAEKAVKKIYPVGLFYNYEEGIYDIGMAIHLDVIQQEMMIESSAEYPLLEWYSFDEWQQDLNQGESKIVPLSKALWDVYRKKYQN